MTPADGFEATFRMSLPREAVWERLTGADTGADSDTRIWLAGFDSTVSVVEAHAPGHLRATKDDEPCSGTDIVVTLEDDETGTRIHVVQSRFGDWLSTDYDTMAIGWRYIVADLQLYLATGVHAQRHLQPWGDLGAETTALDGGIRVTKVQTDGLAHELGLTDGDLLVSLAGAPVASLDDLATVLRVLRPRTAAPIAEWVRGQVLLTT